MRGLDGASGAIMEHLKRYGDITAKEAVELYGCYRLAARIKEFRDDGYKIATIMDEGRTRYGRTCKYARYVLSGDQRK